MIGILNRWRQFGRRYFWPHLLLGMVAASLGLPHASAHDRTTLAETFARSLNIAAAATCNDRLALLQENLRRPSCSVDYWHQHAIRTVIRHLSFTLVSPIASMVKQPLEAQKLALLDTLNALLTHPPVIIRGTVQCRVKPAFCHQTGLWLAQVQGIRAGPLQLI